MPASIREAEAERRTTIADWITAMITIFWSIWWGFFMNKIMESKINTIPIFVPYTYPKILLAIPTSHYLIVTGVITSIFALVYVKWLWNAQRISYKTFLVRVLLRDSIPLGFCIILLLCSMGIAGFSYGISDSLIGYGVVLTLAWPIVVLMTLWVA